MGEENLVVCGFLRGFGWEIRLGGGGKLFCLTLNDGAFHARKLMIFHMVNVW